MCKDIQENIPKFQNCILLVAGGGPVIWIDTWSQEVQGYWGLDKVALPIYDYEHIKDHFEEMCVGKTIGLS